MRVRSVEASGFMRSKKMSVAFPATGLFVITGPNGSGKSSIIEAVSVAAWGKTLRGARPWNTLEKKGGVYLLVDGLHVERTRTGEKSKLLWSLNDDGSPTGNALDASSRLGGDVGRTSEEPWESNTVAQAALERVVGTWDVWRRSCVFSANDAAHFSGATDVERKRLLETILASGVDFDQARHAASLDALTARGSVDNLKSEVERTRQAQRRAREAQATAMNRLDDFRETERPKPLPWPEHGPEHYRTARDAAMKRAADAEAGIRSRRQTVARAEAAAELAAKQSRLLDLDKCPTCEQAIALERRVAAKAEVERLRAEAKGLRTSADLEIEGLERTMREAQRDAAAASSAMVQVKADADLAQSRARLIDGWDSRLGELESDILDANATLQSCANEFDAASEGLADAITDFDELEATVQVLGIRGFRTHLLARSLGGIEAVANAWLPRLGLPNLSMELRPVTEKRTGGINDSIALVINGAGHDEGYPGASAGERRRCDIALLIGLSAVAGASAVEPSTLFFDELFDSLDTDGVTALVTALADLAKDRCVVVVTHNDELATRLPAAQRLHLERTE